MSKKLAFFTFGRLKAEYGHPEVQGFLDRVPEVFESAERMEGFVDRSRREIGNLTTTWGEIVTPKCWGQEDSPKTAATLSIWDDLESVAAFSYHGSHGAAMTRRNDWFVQVVLPEQTAWWIDDGDAVSWQEAADRMDHLFRKGPTPFAFNLKKPFAPDGGPTRLDTARIRQKAGLA
ncbi:MAG TPA: DUF3291 domain-containing protein [Fimbriimonas sp.]|nr:DUF3291 domain-containing protein [Fimbriimonas sp.]